MKTNKIFIAIGTIVTIISLIISYFKYNANINMLIVTEKGSYAEKYAKKHFLEVEYISNTESDKYSKRIEEFEYQEKNDGITITEYKGNSNRLIIPKTIKGKTVNSIDSTILNNQNIKAIVISENVQNLKAEDFHNTTIECFNTSYCHDLKEEKNLNVKILNDSEYVDFNNTSNEYAYELKNNEINLIRNDNHGELSIVPTYINGYPVTEISFDSKAVIGIYIPSSVKKIGGNFISRYLNRTYLVNVLISIVTLIIYILIITLNKKKSLAECANRTTIDITALIYLGITYYFSNTITNIITDYKILLRNSCITTCIFLLISYILIITFNKIEKTSSNNKLQNDFIKEALLVINESSEDDFGIKEELKFSDPISIAEVNSIEEQIMTQLRHLSKENSDSIKKLIKTRNEILKSKK